MKHEKKCRGTGLAIGHGCGQMVPQAIAGRPNRKYGLGISCGCYAEWLYGTEEGKEIVEKHSTRSIKKNEEQQKKDWRIRKENTPEPCYRIDTFQEDTELLTPKCE